MCVKGKSWYIATMVHVEHWYVGNEMQESATGDLPHFTFVLGILCEAFTCLSSVHSHSLGQS